MEKISFQFGGESRQKALILVFIILILLSGLILKFGYFKGGTKPSSEKIFNSQETETKEPQSLPFQSFGSLPQIEKRVFIQVFEHPVFKSLILPEKISFPSPEELGKENPFLPSTPTPIPTPTLTPTPSLTSEEVFPSPSPSPSPTVIPRPRR